MDLSHILFPIAQAAEEAAHATAEQSPDLVGMFGVSWKLFLAQLINFTIVLLVLWKWVFTPVTKALQKRTQKIEDSLKTAENITKEKQEFQKWKSGEMGKARVEASEIVTLAKTEAEEVRSELLAKAKDEQLTMIQEGKEKLEQEQVRMMKQARGQLAELVVQATEKVLREKLDDKKDKQLAEEALKAIK